jgi:serine/threonine-protein kinase
MIGMRLDKWLIDKELGRGGMGRVYLAHEEGSGKQAALKVLSVELAQETGFLHRFQREIDVLSQLSHPNIVRFYESGSKDGHFYFAMEYVDGANFEQLLLERGRLPWKEVLDAALQICPALKHAHDRGVIHRDLKPPNLMRTAQGDVKLTDFGIAKVFAAQHLTTTGGVVGTAEFLSPEQAAGKQATKRSDLYSLGAVLYNLLTGRPPFNGNTSAELLHKHLYAQFDRPQKVVPEIPHDLDEVVCQLLEKDPAHRPADGLVLQRQLDSIRRKMERKAQLTRLSGLNDKTVADNKTDDQPDAGPGSATLMSQLVRQELDRQNQGGTFNRLLNRPVVLLPSFLICVALIIWGFWPRSGRSAEELYAEGSRLKASPQRVDREKAWTEYLEPLNRLYPDNPHRQEVERWRQEFEDQKTLERALAGVKGTGAVTEAQQLYLQGLRACTLGDAPTAQRVWRNLVLVFQGAEEEQRWVELAESGLKELNAKAPSTHDTEGAIRQALERARKLRSLGKATEAAEIEQALRELYPDQPLVKELKKP